MTTIKQILDELRATSSKNEKLRILGEHRSNEDLKQFFYLALNPYIIFYQKKEFDPSFCSNTPQLHLPETMLWLKDMIAGRILTGNAAIDAINSVLMNLAEDDAFVIRAILQKNPDCGVQESTVNKIWKGLIPTYPVLLAEPWSDKLADKLNWSAGVVGQLKADGLRTNIIIDETGGVTVRTRAGNEMNLHGVFDYLGETLKSVVLDGEIVAYDYAKNTFFDRKTTNGLGTKCVRGTISQKEAQSLVLVAWDKIDLGAFKNEFDTTPCLKRFEALVALSGAFGGPSGRVRVIESKILYSKAEAAAYFDEKLADGQEGAMIKDPNEPWSDTRSQKVLKMKSEKAADLRVVGVTEGTGKYAGMIGSLQCVTDDGQLEVSVGSGLTDKDRMRNASEFVDMIIEVKYNQVIESKDRDTKCLFLPIFKKIRGDKTTTSKIGEL